NFQSGLPYMMGPTGGYIAGLWLCSILMPYFSKTYGLSTLSIFLNCLLGQALVYIPGVLWLSNFVGAESAIYNGFLVYIPSGLVKMLVLVTIMRYLGLGRK
ncbi:MAG: biotin transporter BioY, partial [Pseudomonadota bacterium]